MSFYITTDSGSDISSNFIKTFNIKNFDLIYMKITQEESEYDFSTNFLDYKVFYEKMRLGIQSSTSLINTDAIIKFLKPILKKGHDILHIAFSSGLSGTANCALIAINKLKKEFPDRKIFCIDSLCASLGQALMIYYINQMRGNGFSIEDCYQKGLYLKDHICHYVMVDDLKYLLRTGRITKISSFIGTALKIKPFIYMNKYGKLVPIDKGISRKKTIALMINKMLDKITTFEENPIIFISHGDNEEYANYLKNELIKKTPIKNYFIDIISPVIASHSGPGTLAFFFIGKNRSDKKDITLKNEN